jgi:undecaprenyl-diphosphatase
MSILEAIIIGLVQGLTEFLPVSSSGHIEIAKALLGVTIKENLLFTIIVHAATALSTVVIFWKEIKWLISDLFAFKWNEATKYVAFITVSMIPAGVIGVLFEKDIERIFMGNILLVGLMLLVTGGLLFLTTRLKNKGDTKLNFKNVMLIGIAQGIAVLPGISRSGSTIATALLSGVSKEQSARFSFLMVLPVIGGVTLLKIKELVGGDVVMTNIDTTSLVVGFIAAFVSGLVACKWMIKLVKSSKLNYFAIYCFVVGTIAIIASFV